MLPELPPHGEYYDLWICEGYKAGDAVKILNSTTTLSNSGIKFHGWLFFNSLTTSKIPFSFSRTIDYQGTPIPVDYVGEIGITYDQETGLMIEDHQSWTANLTYPGLPQTLSYEVAITYESSNVRFTYITYLLTTGIYTAIFIIIAFLLFVMIYMWRRGREEELPAPPPETPEIPEAPTETRSCARKTSGTPPQKLDWAKFGAARAYTDCFRVSAISPVRAAKALLTSSMANTIMVSVKQLMVSSMLMCLLETVL